MKKEGHKRPKKTKKWSVSQETDIIHESFCGEFFLAILQFIFAEVNNPRTKRAHVDRIFID